MAGPGRCWVAVPRKRSTATRLGPGTIRVLTGAPPIAVPAPRAAFAGEASASRGAKKTRPVGENNTVAPESLPSLAIPPVPSGGRW